MHTKWHVTVEAQRAVVRVVLFLPVLLISGCAARSAPPAPAVEKPPVATVEKPPAATVEKPVDKSPAAPLDSRRAPAVDKPFGILEVRQGLASYYGPGFHGKRTASGITFDQDAMVAAHPTYPFGTVVRVTNLANTRQVVVRVVDRGPAKGPRSEGVVIDLSSGAAADLRFLRSGRTRVRLEVLRWGA